MFQATFAYIPLKIVFGVLCDKLTGPTETTKVIVFNTIAVAGPAVLYLLLAFIPWMPTLSIIVIILIHMLFAASGGGFYKAATLSSRLVNRIILKSEIKNRALKAKTTDRLKKCTFLQSTKFGCSNGT